MTLTVTPNPLIQGAQATVCIGGGPPSTTVTVDIDNGGELSDTLPVELDATGHGCASWPVPVGWDSANFSYGDQEVVRHIVEPPISE